MKGYNNNLELKRYSLCVSNQIKSNKNFMEHSIGSRRKLIIDGKVRATHMRSENLDLGEITHKQFSAFLGSFSKQLYKNFFENESLYDIKINFMSVSKKKNFKKWESMKVGDVFYNIDLKSAYWQILRKLGYIDDNLYTTYYKNDAYKKAKRYCVSFLARKNKMHYKTENLNYDIYCQDDVLKNVYKNIRNELYNSITKAVSLCSDFVEYNIDGISVLANDVDIVTGNLISLGLDYKITRCVKIDDDTYLHGCKNKNFKIKKV
jgi:hypothetical protein